MKRGEIWWADLGPYHVSATEFRALTDTEIAELELATDEALGRVEPQAQTAADLHDLRQSVPIPVAFQEGGGVAGGNVRDLAILSIRPLMRTTHPTRLAMERPSLRWTYSVDHVSLARVKTMLVSEFKAKCIGGLKEVQRTGEPVVVTLRGKPMARVEPLKAGKPGKLLGRLEDVIEVHCDLVRSDTAGDWEMLT